MMRNANIQMKTRVEKAKLLETLRANLERHKAIVQEARDGYVKKVRAALEKRLEAVRKGVITNYSFSIAAPADFSEVYVNSIGMLEWSTEETVELGADEFRQLVRDEWDWQSGFLATNAAYSGQALNWLNETTGGSLVQPNFD